MVDANHFDEFRKSECCLSAVPDLELNYNNSSSNMESSSSDLPLPKNEIVSKTISLVGEERDYVYEYGGIQKGFIMSIPIEGMSKTMQQSITDIQCNLPKITKRKRSMIQKNCNNSIRVGITSANIHPRNQEILLFGKDSNRSIFLTRRPTIQHDKIIVTLKIDGIKACLIKKMITSRVQPKSNFFHLVLFVKTSRCFMSKVSLYERRLFISDRPMVLVNTLKTSKFCNKNWGHAEQSQGIHT